MRGERLLLSAVQVYLATDKPMEHFDRAPGAGEKPTDTKALSVASAMLWLQSRRSIKAEKPYSKT
jgi:hypothetical protein